MDVTIKVGFVGLGKLGALHVQKWSQLAARDNRWHLSSLYDQDLSKVEALKAQWAPQSEPANELEDVARLSDAVVIASPSSTHYGLVKFFLERKKHVFVEKPLALSAQEASDLSDLAFKNQCLLTVGHSERYQSLWPEIRPLLKTWTLWSIDLVRAGPFSPRVADVSVLDDLAIHDLDLLNFVFGIKDIAVKGVWWKSAYSSHWDWVKVALNGAVSQSDKLPIFLTASRTQAQPERRYVLYFREGTVILDLHQSAWWYSVNPGYRALEGMGEVGHSHSVARSDHLALEAQNWADCLIKREYVGPLATATEAALAVSWKEKIESGAGNKS